MNQKGDICNINIQSIPEEKLGKLKLTILQALNEEFNNSPYGWIKDEFLVKKTKLTLKGITPHITYLEPKGLNI